MAIEKGDPVLVGRTLGRVVSVNGEKAMVRCRNYGDTPLLFRTSTVLRLCRGVPVYQDQFSTAEPQRTAMAIAAKVLRDE